MSTRSANIAAMASIRERTSRDGTTTFAVLWRDGSKQRSRTFEDGKIAQRFKLDVELDGETVAVERLAAQAATVNGTGASKYTLDTWMDRYITHLTGVHEGTRTEYRQIYKGRWGKALGRLYLDAVKRDNVAAAQLALSRRGLTAKSIANARGLISAAFDEAVIEGLIDRNPCRGLKLPRTGEDERREMVCLDYDEFARLYEQIPEQHQPLVLTLVGTGARWGEVTALRVGDVDLKAATIRIVRAWKRLPGGITIGPTKTRRSRRTVKLPPELVDELRPLTRGRTGDHLLFTNTGARRDEDPVTIGSFRLRTWQPAVDRSKLGDDRRPRIHDLRHTHASWLISAGIPLTVIQRRLGHESITTTSDTYGHLLPDVVEQSATAAGVVFARLESDAKQLPAPMDELEVIDGEEIDEDD